MKTKAQNVFIATLFIWCGLILGLSFIESWLKFQAPNVTLSIGLGIGRLVFSVSNKMQIFFALVLISIAFWKKITVNYSLIVAIATLLIHTFWLLPALDVRAQEVINGVNHSSSNLHIYFVLIEIIKLVALLTSGFIYLTNKE